MSELVEEINSSWKELMKTHDRFMLNKKECFEKGFISALESKDKVVISREVAENLLVMARNQHTAKNVAELKQALQEKSDEDTTTNRS